MKYFIAASLLLSSSAVFAMPTIGDTASYDATLAQVGQPVVTGTYITQIMSFDATALTYDVKDTSIVNGVTTSQDQTTPAIDMVTDATVTAALANCASFGGTLQTVAIAGGTQSINTCAAPANGDNGATGTIWIAAVPFGFAKVTQTDASGNVTTIVFNNGTAGTGK